MGVTLFQLGFEAIRDQYSVNFAGALIFFLAERFISKPVMMPSSTSLKMQVFRS